MNKKNLLYKGQIDKDDAEWGMINRATLHELSLRIPGKMVIARMVYILLLTYANKEGKCYPKHDTLAKILNVNRPEIVKAYDTLKAHGFIKTKKDKKKKSLLVQIYTVPHKLVFPDAPKSVPTEGDNFPDTEELFSSNDNINLKNTESICMLEHTDTCLSNTSSDCMSTHTSERMCEDSLIDNGTDQENRPDENTMPPILSYNPPKGNSLLKKIKPAIPASSLEIMDYYEYEVKFPALLRIDDDFIREQLPEIQCMFQLIKDWNIYWGFDASEIKFNKKDVTSANKILDYNSFPRSMKIIQELAKEVIKPTKVVGLSYFKNYLLDILYEGR